MVKKNPVERLSARQKLFCTCVAGGMNPSQAAIRAGYSEKGYRSRACRLMKKPIIRTTIEILQEDRASLLMKGVEEGIRRLISISHADITDVVEIVNGVTRLRENADKNLTKNIMEIKTTTKTLKSGQTRTTIHIKLFDKIKAIREMLNIQDRYSRDYQSQPHPPQPHPSQPIEQKFITLDLKGIDLSKLL